MNISLRHIRASALALVLVLGIACDSVQPERTGSLVVETFMNVGEPPADVNLRTTLPLDLTGLPTDIANAQGATVELLVAGAAIDFIETEPGRYSAPSDYDRPLEAGDEFRLHVEWNGSSATARGVIPPAILLDSIVVSVESEPVAAILVDSLRLDTLGVDARTGFIYPIETTAWWTPGIPPADNTWIQAQLRPQREFSSVVVDFFLLPEEVFRESDADVTQDGVFSWTGLYAIPVDSKDLPLPSHTLRVAVVRSDESYADYAIGRVDLDGRGPPSNIDGALGIAAGVSVDSVLVQLGPESAGRRVRVFRR